MSASIGVPSSSRSAATGGAPHRGPSALDVTPELALDAVLSWSRGQGYRGWNKHDGLNSPLLRALFGWGRWPRLLTIQSVMRAPLNLRPLLGVPRTYNPKGLALFAQAYLDRNRRSSDPADIREAQHLLHLLLQRRSRAPSGALAWGYPYPWQDLGFYAAAGTPNAVVTSFVCEAFLSAHRVTGERQYVQVIGETVPFFMKDLTVLKDEPEELCLAYMPLPMRMRVMDVSILIGAVLAQYAAITDQPGLAATARRLVTYVVRRQTPDGAWFYTDPPGDSHIRHDNYHTGFILEALSRYMNASGDQRYADAYWRGLDFYAKRLFNPDGSPRWMSDKDHPHDIHGAAQGILTLSRHRDLYPELAERIAGWALGCMYDPVGRFYYQRTRHLTKRFTLLRWCNAWMARALAALVVSRAEPT